MVTGVSGSGKSSLALDTVGREGERRILETFSSYARRFLEPLGRAAALEWRASDALLDSHPVLSDDFAPVEYYAANAIRRYDAASGRAR